MFNLPETTLVNKKIPKNKFYEKLRADKTLREKFVRQVDFILWKHKLSRHTVNLSPTKEVEEIQVFEVHLKQKNLSREVLESIDRAIPYPILFALVYHDEVKLAVAYKKRSKQHEDRFVVDSYYYSPWQKAEEISLDLLKGLDLQAVYENIIKGLLPESKERMTSLEQAIEKQKAADRLRREIAALEAKIHKEPQFNRKVKYNLELQEKRKELEKILE
ncbi:MAG TPA: DUF4391 domain-containing protein [Desulfotomaculum sp.]|nr:DUF4391 domain-containing protein [Desulfotomaculum sp.]